MSTLTYAVKPDKVAHKSTHRYNSPDWKNCLQWFELVDFAFFC